MSFEIAIRPCVAGDEDALALVGQATFLQSYAHMIALPDMLAHCTRQHASALYRDWLADPAMQLWLASVASTASPVGYVMLVPAQLPIADPQADDLEIKRIYLLHRFQGGGTGRRLMQVALDQARAQGARRVLLGVNDENFSAIAFYTRMGFATVGTRTFQVGATVYSDLVLGIQL